MGLSSLQASARLPGDAAAMLSPAPPQQEGDGSYARPDSRGGRPAAVAAALAAVESESTASLPVLQSSTACTAGPMEPAFRAKPTTVLLQPHTPWAAPVGAGSVCSTLIIWTGDVLYNCTCSRFRSPPGGKYRYSVEAVCTGEAAPVQARYAVPGAHSATISWEARSGPRPVHWPS